MTQRGALVWVACVFFLGVAVGAVGLHLLQLHGRGASAADSSREAARSIGSLLDVQLHLEELSRELDLTPRQVAEVERVLDNAGEDGAALHEDVVPRVVRYLENTKEEIRDLLEPEQQHKLDLLHAEHQRAFHHFLLGRSWRDHQHVSGDAVQAESPSRGRHH